ncbi:small acidic protein-like [Ptychodera flava]|uniref:small acidic protein-like n=1 Tax=Ptychodera flava TaxID=63121 RepID=UPI00396A55B9
MSSEEGNRGEKRPAPETTVHSANSWETADLGDDQRKQKFLRLMGAGKKEHHGKLHIGDHNPVHKRTGDEEKKIQTNLEMQYQHSLSDKLTGRTRRHVGLGFAEEEPPEKKDDKDEKKTEDKKDEEDKQKDVKNVDEKTEQKEAKHKEDTEETKKSKEKDEEESSETK